MITAKKEEAEDLLQGLDMPDYFELIAEYKEQSGNEHIVDPEIGNYTDEFLEWITSNKI
jgi:hypothetical protein